MEATLRLDIIIGKNGPELWSTKFSRGNQEIRCIRGKYVFSKELGSFQWTRAVKSLTLLCCLTRLDTKGGCLMRGGRGSLASSLDWAVSKSPDWTIDMFGTLPSGTALIKRILRRQNPGLRLGGVVAIGLNPSMLKSANVKIYLNGDELNRVQCAALVKSWVELLKKDEKRALGSLEWYN